MAHAEPPPRLPGVRGRRGVPPAGHDGHDGPFHASLRRPQAHLAQPVPRPVRRPRDEPLHHLLPLRALLPGLRRRHGSGGLRVPCADVLRAPRGRRAGEPLRRQPGGGLPHRRVHRQAFRPGLHAQVGSAIRALRLPPLRPRLQHLSRRALRCAQARDQPLSQRSEWLLPVRPGAVRRALREPCQAPSAGRRARRGWRVRRARGGGGGGGRRNAPRRRGVHRHRLAARLAGGQFRAQDAGGRGAVLPRFRRRRARHPARRAEHLPPRRIPGALAGGRGTSGRGADPRRRHRRHRRPHGAGGAPGRRRRRHRHGADGRHSRLARRRRARARTGGAAAAVRRHAVFHRARRAGRADAARRRRGLGASGLRHRPRARRHRAAGRA